jgi:hypothetical protein
MNNFSNEKLIERLVLIISIGLFAFSLSQECFCTDNGCGGEWAGAYILITGCFGFFASPAGFIWLANPAMFISWRYLNKKPTQSLIASLIAVFLSVSFLFFTKVIGNEGGYYSPIIGYKLGYWLWMSSSVTMLIGNLILFLLKNEILNIILRSFMGHNYFCYRFKSKSYLTLLRLIKNKDEYQRIY